MLSHSDELRGQILDCRKKFFSDNAPDRFAAFYSEREYTIQSAFIRLIKESLEVALSLSTDQLHPTIMFDMLHDLEMFAENSLDEDKLFVVSNHQISALDNYNTWPF